MTDHKPQQSNIILYTTPEGDVKIDVFFQDETVWLRQKKMAELFGVEVNTINYHLKEIFKSGELTEDSVIRKIRTTAEDGKEYLTSFYNLDAIISVGYRVNSTRATKFRIWATQTLREFIIKGFVLDDERLKNGSHFDKDYFESLLERIREIRASERRFYQKITDLYATSIDYDANDELTQEFFATVQNKLHWAITGQTAAEIVAMRADSKKPLMGLTTWKHSPKGKILKSDVSIAKNYLNQDEIGKLNRIVEMYLIYGENQAENGRLMTMKNWREKLDAFLQFNEYEILNNPGKVSAKVAKELAENEYEKFRIIQDKQFESDFDKETKKFLKKKK
ncbi:MAG: hypothetical protein UT36_C0003G0057 [Candidatus Peregrinibacteria bacterium GW2011_GWF2_39_17]|nr:MAG: hypothetical protein UT36_C0003G0057 [Candidatus Peregrinibacteria bacterium GW2011_GWF2_39_17]HCW31981.1 cell filamentation protein Fic [Candidatus Peregrinibacteria bacterium]